MSSSYNINLLPARNILPDGTFYGEYLYWDTDTNNWTVGSTTINLGKDAGKTSVDNTIVLNASDISLNAEGSFRFYVKPIRNITDTSGLTVMTYDEITGEITHTDVSNLIFDESGNLNMNCNIIVDVSDITFCNGTSYMEKQQQQDTSINILDLQQIYQFSTGLYQGGKVSINPTDNTKFDISAGVGMISDGSNINTIVQWNDIIGTSVNNITTSSFTHIYFDKGGVIRQIQDISPTAQNRRQYIYLAKLIHDGSFIQLEFNNPELIKDGLTNFYDYFDNISNFIVLNGGIITNSGTNLKLDFSEAKIYRSGINFVNDTENPNIVTLPSQSAFSFTYRLIDASNTVQDASNLDPNNYEVVSGSIGTKTPVPNNKFTNQRIFLFPSGNISAQYGQTVYDKLEDAVNAVRSDSILLNKNIEDNGLLLCVISIEQGTTDLTDSTRVQFTQADQFGKIGIGGGGAGGSVTSLQTAYNNQTDGSITLDIAGTKPFGVKNSSGVSIFNVNNDNTIDISGDVNISGNLDLSCNLLNDVSGIYFCDNTYIGHGASFDISTNEVLKVNQDMLVVDTNGNIGIGTSIPQEKLDVCGNISLLKSESGNSKGSFDLLFNGTTSAGVNTPQAKINSTIYPNNTNAGNLNFYTENQLNNFIKRMDIDGAGNIGFYEDSGLSKRFVWDASKQLIGINIPSPERALHVSSNSAGYVARFERSGALQYDIGIDNLVSGDAIDYFIEPQQANSGYLFRTRNASNNNVSGLSINKDGEVGIGTTIPSSRLDIQDTDINATVNIRSTATASDGVGARIILGQTSDSIAQIEGKYVGGTAGANKDLLFYSGGNISDAKMVLDGNGNLGVGTTDPSTNLHVVIDNATNAIPLRLTNKNSGSLGSLVGIQLENTGTTSNFPPAVGSSNNDIIFLTGPSSENTQERVRINQSGNVGIGTTDPSGTKLVVNDDTSNNVLLVTNTKIFGEIGDICGSYPIAYFSVKQDPELLFRGLEIGAPSGGVTAPVYLKVKGTSNRLGILNTNNTENMTILDNGNVGIGKIDPTAKLHIISDAPGQSFNALNITNLTDNASGVKTQINLPVFNGAEGGVIEEIGNSIDGYRLNIYQGQTSGQLTFGTGGNNERMRITNNGNIGVGTSSPDWKMEVVGNESTLGISTTRYDSDGTLGGPSYFIGRSANGSETTPLDNSSVGVKIIGQGYRSGFRPLGEIDINGSGNTTSGSGIKGNITFRTTSDDNAFSEKMIITSEGNVGIGTTTPQEKLEVSGSVTISEKLYLPNISNATQTNALYYNTSTGEVTSGIPTTTYYKGNGSSTGEFYSDEYINIRYIDTNDASGGFQISKTVDTPLYKIKGIAIKNTPDDRTLINFNLSTTYTVFNGRQQTGFFHLFSSDDTIPFYKIDATSIIVSDTGRWHIVIQKFT